MTQQERDDWYIRYAAAVAKARVQAGHNPGEWNAISEIHVHPDVKPVILEILTSSEESLKRIGTTIVTDDSMAQDQIAFVFER
jgi:hypothetical protein